MPALHNLYKRSEPRVLYRAPVWIRPTNHDSSLVGETRNLSRRGMFVSVAPTPPLGQEVMCELPGRPAVRGRVAWVLPSSSEPSGERAGVGIEFIDLSPEGVAASAALLENLTGMRLDEAQPVHVWFDGLPSPTRSIAQVTHAGVDLSTALSFLRIGSEVAIGSVGDDSNENQRLRGRVARVELRTDDGVPRLAISVAVLPEPAPMALEPQDERWFPEVVVEATAVKPMVLEAPVAATVELPAAPPVVASPIAMPLAVPEAELDVEHTERNDMTTTPRRMRGLAVLGGVVLAGLIILRVGFPVGDRSAPLPASAPPVAETVPAPSEPAPTANEAEPVAAAEVAEPTQVVEPAPKAVAAKFEVPKAVAPKIEAPKPVAAKMDAPKAEPSPAAKGGPWKPELVTTDGGLSLVVPIAGSPKGLSRYALDQPAGVAVDLPAAKPAVALKPYVLHDAVFQSLWVRARPAGGLQIRLHVQKGTRVAVEPVDGGLRFRRLD